MLAQKLRPYNYQLLRLMVHTQAPFCKQHQACAGFDMLLNADQSRSVQLTAFRGLLVAHTDYLKANS